MIRDLRSDSSGSLVDLIASGAFWVTWLNSPNKAKMCLVAKYLSGIIKVRAFIMSPQGKS